MIKRVPGWKWRDGEISLKVFYELSYEDRKKYVESIKQIPVEEQSTGDEYLIRMYSLKEKPKNFLTLE